MSVKTYYRCTTCEKECHIVDCQIEVPVYEPFSGVDWEVRDGIASHCCSADFVIFKTLPLTKRGKDNLLRLWNRRGNAEITNHIENVLPYIGEVNE